MNQGSTTRLPLFLSIPALLVLAACGSGGGAEACFYDAFGTYVCVGSGGGSYYKPDAETDACEVVSWDGSANGAAVLDATQDALFVEADAGHVLRIGHVRIADVHVRADGSLLWQGVPVARIALVPGEHGAPVAALVDADGRLLDLRTQDGGLWLLVTSDARFTTATSAGPCTSEAGGEVVASLGGVRDADARDDLLSIGSEIGLAGLVDLGAR